MKNLSIMFFVFTMGTLDLYASGNEVRFTTGGLYEIPYSINEKIYLELDYPHDQLQNPAFQKSLDSQCLSIKKLLREAPLSNRVIIESYESLRESPFPKEISYNTFAVRFRINKNITRNSVMQNSATANNLVGQGGIDQVKQENADIELESANFSVVSLTSDSLTNIAAKAGVRPLPIELANGTSYPNFEVGNRTVTFPTSLMQEDYLKLYVRGRDTFCDLIAGKASLLIQGQGNYKANTNDLEQISDFYDQSFSPAVDEIFQNKKSVVGRAALTGYKIGEMIKNHSEQNLSEENISSKISYIVETLFNSTTFERNNMWVQENRSYKVQIPQFRTAPVSLTFEVVK
jgi:hypothetical protein